MIDKTILTGIKPTGAPHIGNYIGAIRPAIKLAETHAKSYLFIADYHALNIVRDPEVLRQDTYEVAACYLSLGLDPAKTAFYRQSDIPEIFELSTILSAVTPKGLMDRATSYKAAMDKNKEAGKDDPDHGINMGLYTYPILMAADILIADTDIVPVGKDQVQHVEFSRDMAGYFNNNFMPALKLPEYQLDETGGAILPGLDGRKMSKSYNNHIPVFMESKKRRKLIMKIVTDSKLPEDPKDPDENIVFQLYKHFATEEEIKTMHDAFEKGGMGYGDAKQLLFETLERKFEIPSALYQQYMDDTSKLDALLDDGAIRMRKIARETLSRVRETIGLKSLI